MYKFISLRSCPHDESSGFSHTSYKVSDENWVFTYFWRLDQWINEVLHVTLIWMIDIIVIIQDIYLTLGACQPMNIEYWSVIWVAFNLKDLRLNTTLMLFCEACFSHRWSLKRFLIDCSPKYNITCYYSYILDNLGDLLCIAHIRSLLMVSWTATLLKFSVLGTSTGVDKPTIWDDLLSKCAVDFL